MRVIVPGKKIHGLKQLVVINERSDNDERAKEPPAPIGTGAKRVANAAAAQFISDPRGL